ncbi:metal-sensing transcriptional repressor, partial [Paraburkholderia aspalathi]|nr:metal-sensing transcriptional repressor [Paraburkholderia aspalathi]
LLQQLAALRGAATGLMAEVLESHLRETFGQAGNREINLTAPEIETEIDQLMRIIRTYLK